MLPRGSLIIIFLFLILILILIFKFKGWNMRNAMVIVEPRNHPFLKTVIDNFDRQMDSSWDLYVFHGTKNADYAAEAIKHIVKRRVFLRSIDTDNLDADKYNSLFKKAHFWNKIQAENILIFQTDAALCSKSSKTIYDFINFDYIGCSYDNIAIGKNAVDWWGKDNSFYGVGGLSFRKKSFILKCISDNPNIEDNFAEDVFFSNCVVNSVNKPRTANQIADFCTQSKFTNKSFGAHQTSTLKKDSGQDNYDMFAEFCPEIKKINQ